MAVIQTYRRSPPDEHLRPAHHHALRSVLYAHLLAVATQHPIDAVAAGAKSRRNRSLADSLSLWAAGRLWRTRTAYRVHGGRCCRSIVAQSQFLTRPDTQHRADRRAAPRSLGGALPRFLAVIRCSGAHPVHKLPPHRGRKWHKRCRHRATTRSDPANFAVCAVSVFAPICRRAMGGDHRPDSAAAGAVRATLAGFSRRQRHSDSAGEPDGRAACTDSCRVAVRCAAVAGA